MLFYLPHNLSHWRHCWYWIVLSSISFVPTALGQPQTNTPILFRCDHLFATQRLGQQQCLGNVIVYRDQTWICCDKLDVHLNSNQQPTHMLCQQNVRLQRGEHLAWGALATYEPDKQRILLTGRPMVQRQQSLLLGDKMIFFINREDMEVSHAHVFWQNEAEPTAAKPNLPLAKLYQPTTEQTWLPSSCPLPNAPTLPAP